MFQGKNLPLRKTARISGRIKGGERGAPALMFALACVAVVLGCLLFNSVRQTGAWQRRSAELENSLEQARSGISAVSAEDAKRLESEAALAREKVTSLLSELETQKSLVAAKEERCAALSAENSRLLQLTARLQTRTQSDAKEIEALGKLLTQAEEDLAGVETLYKEATRELGSVRVKNLRSESELAALQTLLTLAEENYAGASALLSESIAAMPSPSPLP